MKRVISVAIIFIFVFVGLVSANTYGAKTYGCGLYGIGCSDAVEVPSSTGGGGGGSIRQFDIKILDFESPINLGESFNFMYFVKGVGDFNVDITIDFWVEKEGEIITSGSDIVFMGSNEEKTEAASLFMPSGISSGTYKFVIKVSYGNIKAEAHRTIELTVRDGEAIIDSLFDIRFSLEEILLTNAEELSAITIFENFGKETTLVNLTFIILDEKENEVYREEESVIVETEIVLRKSFEGLNLDSGKYTIVLQTLYGLDVMDEFRQDFEIKEKKEIKLWNWIFTGIIFILIILLAWCLFIKKRKKEDLKKRVKVFKKPMKERKKEKLKIKSRKTIHKKIEKEIGKI